MHHGEIVSLSLGRERKNKATWLYFRFLAQKKAMLRHSILFQAQDFDLL